MWAVEMAAMPLLLTCTIIEQCLQDRGTLIDQSCTVTILKRCMKLPNKSIY